MLRSKATAALIRLKEMDRKYNIKHKEAKWAQGNVSTESSLKDSPKNTQPKSFGNNKPEAVQAFLTKNAENETRSKVSPKSKIEVKIFSHPENADHLLSDETVSSTNSSRVSPKTKTESVTETDRDTDNEIKNESVSRTEKSPRILSNLKSSFKGYNSKSNSEKDNVTILEPEDSYRNDDKSSVSIIFPKQSGTPETISEIKSTHELSSKKSNENLNISEKIMTENVIQELNSDNNETTIDELIKISSEKSEIISELSNVDKDDSTDRSLSTTSFKDEQKLRYENDTFEEASSSTTSLSSTEERLKKNSEEGEARETIILGVKKIKITPHKQVESTQDTVTNDRKVKEIIELVAPKIIQSNSECDVGLDEELSNYVKTTENVDEVLPINLLKLSKQTPPTKKQNCKSKRHRKSSNENTEEKTDSLVASDQERLIECRESRKEDAALKKHNSLETTKSIKNERKEQKEIAENKEVSLLIEQNKVEHVGDKEVPKSETVNEEPETISSEKLLRETPKKSDVTSTLRELNKDAINAIIRRHRMQTGNKISDIRRQCKNCGTIVKLPSTEYEAHIEDEESKPASLENIKTNSSHNQRMKGKRNKVKRNLKPAKIRKTSYHGKVEEKHFDCKQIRRLRKQVAVLRLQQERKDIRNYLLELELERTRLGFGPNGSTVPSKLAAFKPLEFPKIAAFEKPDVKDGGLKSKDEAVELQERVLTIRQWLKDQYLLYRNYSKLTETMNSKYIPASLEDAKKTIRQLQRATIKTR